MVKFDTDSEPIAIDSCASYSLTHQRKDFIPDTIKAVSIPIKGLGNTVSKFQVTVVWTIQDQHGQSVSFKLQNVLLVEDLPFRLLSPQHWAQCAKQTHGRCYRRETNNALLEWGGNCRRIPLSSTNIAVITTAPAYKKYQAYLSQTKHDPQKDFVISQAFLSEKDDTH